MTDLRAWAQAQQPAQRALIDALCRIPAPSHRERARAEAIAKWLLDHGVQQVEIDEADNVIVPPRTQHGPLTMLMAHTDTVFPDEAPFSPYVQQGRMYCPGVGDDTANVAALMLLAAYAAGRQGEGWDGFVFAANSCEEGLGNLKGCRALMDRYGDRLGRVLSLDGDYDSACNRAVGSRRYEVTLRTEGGHSFGDFGNASAIHAMALLIQNLYAVKPPKVEGCKTTYNVGRISGGTSVNTIAQQAKMLYEYRSDDAESLEWMERMFRAQMEAAQAAGVEADVQLLGERPGMGRVDEAAQHALETLCLEQVKDVTGKQIPLTSGSTDINLPLNRGIPAFCFGAYRGGGAHTREEWIDLHSLEDGLAIWLGVLLRLAGER